VVGATLLPFEPARGASTSPRFGSSTGPAGADGFAGAMNGALAAPREASRGDDAPRTSRRSEPVTAREADDRPAAPSRRSGSARPADAKKTDRGEAAADAPTTARSADGANDAAAEPARAEEPRAEAKTGSGEAGQAGGEVPAETAETTAVETIAKDAVSVGGTAPLPDADGDDAEAEGGEDSPARGRRWPTPSADQADEDGEAAGAHGAARRGEGGAGSGLKVGQAMHQARAEAAATAGEATGPIAQAVAAAVHADATANANAAANGAPVTQALETATAAKAASGAEAATAIETAIAAVETVAGVEPSAEGSGTGGSDAREQAQPKPQASGPQGNGSATTPVGASETGVRFTVNSAAGNAAYTSAAPRGEEAAVMPQIVKSIRLQAVQGTTEARVQLKPEHLGNLNITLKVEHNQVTATIQADVAAVRQWIQSHEASLRQALSEQGLHLASLVVHPDEEQTSADERNGERQGGQPRRRSWRDDEQTFEVLV
jgi:flagellar hook-length control protein FliK